MSVQTPDDLVSYLVQDILAVDNSIVIDFLIKETERNEVPIKELWGNIFSKAKEQTKGSVNLVLLNAVQLDVNALINTWKNPRDWLQISVESFVSRLFDAKAISEGYNLTQRAAFLRSNVDKVPSLINSIKDIVQDVLETD